MSTTTNTRTTTTSSTTPKGETLVCNPGDLGEAHGALFLALGELAAALDAVADTRADDVVRDRVVATIAHIGSARNSLLAAVREVCPEVEGLTLAAARSMEGGAA